MLDNYSTIKFNNESILEIDIAATLSKTLKEAYMPYIGQTLNKETIKKISSTLMVR